MSSRPATATARSSAEAHAADRRPSRRPDPHGGGQGAGNPDPPLILVAEDSPTQARWLETVLRSAGYRVVVANDGPTSVRMARAERPTLILADVDMPGMNGFEVCREIKDDPGLRSIPYVMVTHRDRVTDLVRALEAGADNYLTKPLDEAAVTARVKRILDEMVTWRKRVATSRSPSGFPLEEMMLSLERDQVVEMLMAGAQKLEEELAMVSAMGATLTTTHDLPAVLSLFTNRVGSLSDATVVTVVLRSDSGDWTMAAVLPDDEQTKGAIGSFMGPDETMPFDVAALTSRKHQVIRSDDPRLTEPIRRYRAQAGITETHVWPLVLEGGLIGALTVSYGSRRDPTADEVRRFRFLADQAAQAVVHARMFDQERSLRLSLEAALVAEQEAHKNAMFMLAAAVEARDGLTGSHLRRVQAYAEALARRLALADEVVKEIGYSSILHDVGKLLVPDEILGKPGKLSEQEWVEMRRHPDYGSEILGDRDFFGMARDIAKCHHERWDGTGYPAGLSGEEIPIAARITSVADVFDALTTRRPYKEPWSDEDALAEIRRLSGTGFDPTVVTAFLDLYDTGDIAAVRTMFSEA